MIQETEEIAQTCTPVLLSLLEATASVDRDLLVLSVATTVILKNYMLVECLNPQ